MRSPGRKTNVSSTAKIHAMRRASGELSRAVQSPCVPQLLREYLEESGPFFLATSLDVDRWFFSSSLRRWAISATKPEKDAVVRSHPWRDRCLRAR